MTSLGGCHPQVQAQCSTCAQYEASIREWRAGRIAALRAEHGWLALAGLYWLDSLDTGEHRLGADPGADLVFPEGAPPEIGRLRLQGGEVSLQVAPGVDARIGELAVTQTVLRSDVDPKQPPDRVHIGERFTFFILSRGGRLGVRLYDSASPARREFAGIDSFPVASEWRIQARFEAHAQPREIEHPTVLGTVQAAQVPGVAVFSIAGREHRLTPILEAGPAGQELLFVFRDQTSGVETYTGGRFLIAALAQDGTVELDFNKAHNPPCAFTPYATCPVPLPENRLPIRIEAGEKLPADHPAP
ncbi:MAG: DUF1684 domain-containing protein [Nannocystis sp.]|nr:DUF1684 domain-containing protein [Nannocystis sp.]